MKLNDIPTKQVICTTLAVLLLAIVLLQLFSFEKFPGLLAAAGLPKLWTKVAATALVAVEVAALPWLLGLQASKRVRGSSKLAGFVALGLLSGLEMGAYCAARESIVFGATFELPSGSWALFFLLALWTLLVWAHVAERITVPQKQPQSKKSSKTQPKKRSTAARPTKKPPKRATK